MNGVISKIWKDVVIVKGLNGHGTVTREICTFPVGKQQRYRRAVADGREQGYGSPRRYQRRGRTKARASPTLSRRHWSVSANIASLTFSSKRCIATEN